MLGALVVASLISAMERGNETSAKGTTLNVSTGASNLSFATPAMSVNSAGASSSLRFAKGVNASATAASDTTPVLVKGLNNRTERAKDVGSHVKEDMKEKKERSKEKAREEIKVEAKAEEIVDDLKAKLKETKASMEHQQHLVKSAKEELQAVKTKEDFFGGRMELVVLLTVLLSASVATGLFVSSERSKRALQKEMEAMSVRFEQEKERRGEKETAAAFERQQIIEAAAVNAAATA